MPVYELEIDARIRIDVRKMKVKVQAADDGAALNDEIDHLCEHDIERFIDASDTWDFDRFDFKIIGEKEDPPDYDPNQMKLPLG